MSAEGRDSVVHVFLLGDIDTVVVGNMKGRNVNTYQVMEEKEKGKGFVVVCERTCLN